MSDKEHLVSRVHKREKLIMSNSAFRRGKKYYYGSDIWDVGDECGGDEARTSFRLDLVQNITN